MVRTALDAEGHLCSVSLGGFKQRNATESHARVTPSSIFVFSNAQMRKGRKPRKGDIASGEPRRGDTAS